VWPAQSSRAVWQSGGRAAVMESVGCLAGDAGSCCRSGSLHDRSLPIFRPSGNRERMWRRRSCTQAWNNPCAYTTVRERHSRQRLNTSCSSSSFSSFWQAWLGVTLLFSTHSRTLHRSCLVQRLTSCPCLSSSCSPRHRRHSPASRLH